MVRESVYAVTELDRDTEGEYRALKEMLTCLRMIHARYHHTHSLHSEITLGMMALSQLVGVYSAYLPVVYTFEHEEEVPADAARS